MQTIDVVHVVQERAEVHPRFLEVLVLAEIRLFFLERKVSSGKVRSICESTEQRLMEQSSGDAPGCTRHEVA